MTENISTIISESACNDIPGASSNLYGIAYRIGKEIEREKNPLSLDDAVKIATNLHSHAVKANREVCVYNIGSGEVYSWPQTLRMLRDRNPRY